MERLTKTYSDGSFGVADNLPCGENSYTFKDLLIKKLGEYEDLEEQGRLIKLPCDKVYYIIDKNNPKYAAVMSKTIRDLTVYEIENIDIDGRYFSTKELAEAKLKELRGGEND